MKIVKRPTPRLQNTLRGQNAPESIKLLHGAVEDYGLSGKSKGPEVVPYAEIVSFNAPVCRWAGVSRHTEALRNRHEVVKLEKRNETLSTIAFVLFGVAIVVSSLILFSLAIN